MENNFVKYCLSNGGEIQPLLIEANEIANVGLCNPTVYVDGDKIRLILRNVNYCLWASDDEYKFTSPYGPLCYITRESDVHLRTRNFLCELSGGELTSKLIDTEKFDVEPLWEFVGLEDARLVRWDGRLYGTGVRRDTTTDGQGRMELSELSEDGQEISRVRIAAPGNIDTYCEKNWMPILDMPFHYVKWCNPLEIVKVNPLTGDSETVIFKEIDQETDNLYFDGMDIRGSSQVIRYQNYHIAITHSCKLYMNEKGQKSGAGYFERFIVWDNDWNVVRISRPFKFAGFGIEFTNGLAIDGKEMLIPFALQDNFSFLLRVGIDTVMNFIFSDKCNVKDIEGDTLYERFFNDTTNSYVLIELAQEYYSNGHYSTAVVLAERACEYNTFKSVDELYESVYICGLAMSKLPERDSHELALWLRMIDILPNRSEGYYMLSRYYYWRNEMTSAYTFARLAYCKNYHRFDDQLFNAKDYEIQYAKCTYYTERYLESEGMLNRILNDGGLTDVQIEEITGFMEYINGNKENRYRVL